MHCPKHVEACTLRLLPAPKLLPWAASTPCRYLQRMGRPQ